MNSADMNRIVMANRREGRNRFKFYANACDQWR